MTYSDICERLEEAAPGATVLVSSSGKANAGGGGGGSGGTNGRTYPLATLREKDPEKLPQGIDLLHKEVCVCVCLRERERVSLCWWLG